MDQRIIYTSADGKLTILIPAPECGLTIEEIAAKDVPAGIEYQIVDASVARELFKYTPPPEPTKAELLAQLQELTAKIEALGA